jgi:hypothetical protein
VTVPARFTEIVTAKTAQALMTPRWLRKPPSATIRSQGAGGKKFSIKAASAMIA